MKLKTSELTGAALDWAVAEAKGVPIYRRGMTMTRMDMDGQHYWQPSTDWHQGGPIIEWENIELAYRVGVHWIATRVEGSAICEMTGPTQLVAAMRCYVKSQFGDEVDVPDELV